VAQRGEVEAGLSREAEASFFNTRLTEFNRIAGAIVKENRAGCWQPNWPQSVGWVVHL